jgi:hypothetical protein
MIQVTIDDKEFMRAMNNIVNYAVGFAEGVKSGEPKLLDKFGNSVVEALNEFIDSNSRVDPAKLHHVYEWNQEGKSNQRLFNINYRVGVKKVQITSELTQSLSVKPGSKVPFSNKASVMENGMPVTIRPKNSKVLVFEDNGETVFTQKPITILNPGGNKTVDGFGSTVQSFFNVFSQSFLKMNGMTRYLERPKAFVTNLGAGKRGGRNVGLSVGYNWIINAGVND